MKNLSLIILIISLANIAFSQNIHYTKEPVIVGLAVIEKGNYLNLDTLCSGYDPETGAPLDLVVPAGASLSISKPDSAKQELAGKFMSRTFDPFKGSSISSTEGSEMSILILNRLTSDSLTIRWQIDFRKPKLVGLLPVDQAETYLNSVLSSIFEKSEDLIYNGWKDKEYIVSVDRYGVPVNPEFPTDMNDLIFALEQIRTDYEIQLMGYEDSSMVIKEENPQNTVTYRDLAPGNYELVVKAYKGAPEKHTLHYPFLIAPPWYLTTVGILTLGFLILLMIGLISFLIYRSRVRRTKQKLEWQRQLADSELKAIRSQLNPHFMFNALNAIQNLIGKGENKLANEYVSKFAGLMRRVLDQSSSSFNDLNTELENIRGYLELEKLRMPFKYEIKVSEEVSGDMLVPVLLLQPYVENAILHGIFGQEGGVISVNIYQKDGHVIFQIADNGRGLSESFRENSGLYLSKERVSHLDRIYDGNASVTIRNRKDQVGVMVTITLPSEI